MKVLVTGGAGFIGSHACKALAQAGHTPISFDNLSTGHADAVKWGPLEIGDIRDPEAVDRALAAHQPEVVMHFAALAYVGESVRDPATYYDTNVAGALTLLRGMRARGVDRFIFSSTCATYGVPETLPITETLPQAPINPYGYTKLVVERMLADFERAYGLRWVALRYFNAAGADPDGELGERHDPETHALPLAIWAALGLGPAFQLFGDDYPTPDGSAVRDYVHVSDLAEAHVKAADYLTGGGASRAFNLATGVGTSVLELIAAVEQVTGRPVPLNRGPRRPGDPPALWAQATPAREVLGWTPRFMTIGPMVATAANWYAKQAGRNEPPLQT